MLFDLLLARAGVSAASIDGYDRLEFTHTAVAALVADGIADCGLGIRAAAIALEVDFVPLAREPYDSRCSPPRSTSRASPCSSKR